MYCPNCATQNLDDARYCRACGADIHLVPVALAGTLPAGDPSTAAGAKPVRKSRKKKDEDARLLEKGMENVFVGLAFLIIFLGGLFYMRGAFFLWVWFIIPALSGFGEGIGQLLRARRDSRLLTAGVNPYQFADESPRALHAPPPRAAELAAPDTAEMIESPFSVTEATTRHLKNGRAGNVPKQV